jgi:hypothetical protein
MLEIRGNAGKYEEMLKNTSQCWELRGNAGKYEGMLENARKC